MTAAGEQATTARRQLLAGYGFMFLWIGLSATVIFINKWILDPKLGGFPYPLALTTTHMLFCSIVAWVIIKAGFVEAPSIETKMYLTAIVPVGAMFAIVLWLGNAAYLYLSVSFIQMLKASMPLLVYLAGCAFTVEVLHFSTMVNMLVVVTGIVVATFGELQFVLIGVVLQMVSIVTEAVRLTLVQILLQRRGIKLNPITTMYLISPVCFAFLLPAMLVWEAPDLLDGDFTINPFLMAASVLAAFALNVSVFLLVGKTSALTMNIAGVIKDVMLVTLSVTLYGSAVTQIQLAGYALALAGVGFYNYSKIKAAQLAAAATAAAAAAEGDDTKRPKDQDVEAKPLLQKQ